MTNADRHLWPVPDQPDAPDPEDDMPDSHELAVREPAGELEPLEPTRVWSPRRTIDVVVAPFSRQLDVVRDEHGGLLGAAAKVSKASAFYGMLGLGRAAGGWWRWVTAAEYNQVLATQPQMVQTERARRRTVSLYTLGAGVAGDGALVLFLDWPWWGAPSILLAVTAAAGGVTEVFVRRAKREQVETDASEAAARDIGTRPAGKAVRALFIAQGVKIAKRIEDVRVITPGVVRDGDAWICEVELPGGVVYDDVIKKRVNLAGAAGRGATRFFLDRVPDHEGRVRIWAPDRDPLAGPPVPSPLIGRDKPFNVWTERVYMGRSPRGQLVDFALPGKAMLTGGEPGSGKSVADDQVLCAAALDPNVPLILADAKRVELAVYKRVAVEYLTRPDPELYLDMIERLVAEMDRRYEVMEDAGVVKITAKNWKRLGCPFTVFHTDEVQFFTTSKLGGKDGPITVGLADLVGRGRASGIFTSIATQRPAAEVVPTRLRDIITMKLAMMCFTNAASDTILGQGMASRGYSGAHFNKDHKGAGWLHAEGSEPVQLRTGYLNKPDEGEGGNDDVRDIVEVAYRLRAAAGTLPYSESNPDVILTKTLLDIIGSADGMWTQDLLPRLNTVEDFADMTAGELAKRLRAVAGDDPDAGPKGLWLPGEDGKATSRNGYERTYVQRCLQRLKGGGR
ncbi:FtsK/SpoIIIE domain-containing protein [Nonomuraea sp. MTCD27]|uniref:FtsK/SpoIIIE domain-containing protein n=1 Tax=Nonomuraea sp. MTCD27 TaxID=1676747 RepID=UPI0035BFF6E9